jgi:hypothetical protein
MIKIGITTDRIIAMNGVTPSTNIVGRLSGALENTSAIIKDIATYAQHGSNKNSKQLPRQRGLFSSFLSVTIFLLSASYASFFSAAIFLSCPCFKLLYMGSVVDPITI